MDADSEIARAKWLIFGGALFLVSTFVSYREAMYLISGVSTNATLTSAYEITRRRYFVIESTRLTVEYSFSEPDGTRRKGKDTVSPTWVLPDDGTVPIRHMPGADGRSRLAGHVNWAGLILFVGSLAVVGFGAFRLWQKASAAVGTAPPRRK